MTNAPPRCPSSALAAWLDRIGVEHPSGVRRGLAGVREVASRLGALPPAATTVVVAGTNGKGSTVAATEHLLLAAGHSVGATVSPHIHVFNERIRLRGKPVRDDAIVAAFEAVEASRGDVQLSYFEYAILAALHVIAGAKVEFAVLEVGLGGRLDAVNAVDADVAVVTNIGLDHQEYLGATREAIGAEKVDVARPGRPLVIGEANPPRSVLRHAERLAAPAYLAGRDFGHADGRLWLRGNDTPRAFEFAPAAIHPANAATALQAAQLAGCRASQRGVDAAARASNPGRFETVCRDGRTWVLDVAHNAEGAAFLATQLRARFPKRRIGALVGCLADKDARGIVAALRGSVHEFAFVATNGARGQSAAATRAQAGEPRAFADSLEAAMKHLCQESPGGNGVILACGSFEVVERTRDRLGLHV